jgi:hypothetical protein
MVESFACECRYLQIGLRHSSADTRSQQNILVDCFDLSMMSRAAKVAGYTYHETCSITQVIQQPEGFILFTNFDRAISLTTSPCSTLYAIFLLLKLFLVCIAAVSPLLWATECSFAYYTYYT